MEGRGWGRERERKGRGGKRRGKVEEGGGERTKSEHNYLLRSQGRDKASAKAY